MSKRTIASTLLLVLFVAAGSSCIFRKSKMSGTYDGEWEGEDGGTTSDEITIDGAGAGELIVECDECGIVDEMDAEIVSNEEFEIDESNVTFEADDGTRAKLDFEAEGTVDNRELELEAEYILSNGQTIRGTFEGDKE